MFNESSCAGEWVLIDDSLDYPDYDSGYGNHSGGPAYEGLYYPEPDEKVSAKTLIDDALSQGYDMPAYGDPPPNL